jgi:hypothetical protein
MERIKLLNVRVYALKDEISIIEHDGKLKDRTTQKPKLILRKDVDKIIDMKDLKFERQQYKKSETDIIQFTYEHL